jgi:hypothetical protein
MKKINSILGMVVLMTSLFSPQIAVLAQGISSMDIDNLTQEEYDNLVKEREQLESSRGELPEPLSPTPPTAEEVERWIKESEDNPPEEIPYISTLKEEGLKNASLGNCFDVYKFNNIRLGIIVDQNEYQTGAEAKPGSGLIRFTGNIENNNNYPLVDLKIKAKIVKIEQEGNKRIVKTVDEIVIKDNISLASQGTQEIDESYQLPIKAAKGDYEILLSVVSNDQISVAGLSFTDDVYASKLNFKIEGDNTEEIIIKQKDITINDVPYNNLSFNPKYRDKRPVTIKVPIQNNTDTDKEVEVEYEVYSWSDDIGKIKKELKQLKTIAKQGTSIASYTIEEQAEAVYYIKIKVRGNNVLTNMSWKNIANIRFVNEDISEPRIAAVTLNTSPYSPEKGDIQLLTCIHNTNETEVETIVENTIKDESGKIIASSEYKGTVTGQVDGIYTQLPKNKRYNTLMVTSTIKDKDGNILNTVDLNYDCKELNPNQCGQGNTNGSIWVLLGGLLVLGGLVFGFREYRRRALKSIK